LIGGFTYIAGDLIPEIYAISPNSGPIAGGTRVTISGKGFQNPVQVLFGDRQAQVVSVNYDEVIVISPSISPSQPNTPETVQVTVRNIRNGQVSNGVPFRYGEAMFISSISPNEGPADVETLVTIFGQGFESPVRVMVGDVQATPVSVAGTQIVARFPALPESARSCGDVGRTVSVTNINSNITADGPDFFYRAERVLITSVTVDSGTSNIIQQYLPVNPSGAPCLTPWSSHTVTINGSGFQRIGTTSAMYVRFEGVTGEYLATYVSPTQLTLTLPDLDSVNIQRVGCVLGTGETGARNIDTPVAVTVVNKRNSCQDTLPAALIIRPCDTTCRAAFPLNLILSGLGSVSVTLGSTSPSTCDTNCSFSVLSGTGVILSAAPDPPEPGETNVLLSWSCTGDAAGCTNNYPTVSQTCSFTMSQQTQCTATFGPIPPP
jgi:hypothetical protein